MSNWEKPVYTSAQLRATCLPCWGPNSRMGTGGTAEGPKGLKPPPSSRKGDGEAAQDAGQTRGLLVHGLRESFWPPWALRSQFHSLLGGSGPAWSSCPACHHKAHEARRNKRGQHLRRDYTGAAIFARHCTFQHRVLRLVELQLGEMILARDWLAPQSKFYGEGERVVRRLGLGSQRESGSLWFSVASGSRAEFAYPAGGSRDRAWF